MGSTVTVSHFQIGMPMQDQERLTRLAAFGPIFRDPTATFGTWRVASGTGRLMDPLKPTWYEHSLKARAFLDMANTAGWVLIDFDWIRWQESAEGKVLLTDRQAIASADCVQLGKLLTTLVRADRLSEGTLAKAYDKEILLAIFERAECLLNKVEKVF